MKTIRMRLFFILVLIISYSCNDSLPISPYKPNVEESLEAIGYWQDVISADKNYPSNVYLTKNILFNPGKVGSSRISASSQYYDSEGYPYDKTKNGACGPPEGSTATYSNAEADMTVLGCGGEAVWQFDDMWVIVNKEGSDFVLFSNHNVINGTPDNSWNELAHVYVSEDNNIWYKSKREAYTENSKPGIVNSCYSYNDVIDLFGNNHTWANFRKNTVAQYLDPQTGCYQDLIDANGSEIVISKYFKPTDKYLGGDYFDLSNFVRIDDPSISWPQDGRMRFLKLVDDPKILDGQDCSPSWMVGARLMSAMGVNVEKAE